MGRCRNVFVILMGGALVISEGGPSGCQDQCEGCLTAMKEGRMKCWEGKVGTLVVCQKVVAVVRALRSCPARSL